jgi:hypothetical protein
LSGTPAPIIVTATFVPADAAMLNNLRRIHFPPERNHLDAHLTMFHHLPPSVEAELQTRLRTATSGSAPTARLAGVMSLGGGTAFRIDSPGLAEVRDKLAEAFAPMLTPQDSGGWRAHVTIQNKVKPEVARALKSEIERDFRPRPIGIAGLAAWWYRGGPWELLSRHSFRG